MGATAAKLEGFNQLQEDLKELEVGAMNIEKLQKDLTAIHDSGLEKLGGFKETQHNATEKVTEAVNQVKEIEKMQQDLTTKIQKLTGAMGKMAKGAVQNQINNVVGGIGNFF